MRAALLLLQLLPLLLAKWSELSPEYIEYEEGTGLPLIISSPHGGTKKPKDIPNRTCEGITKTTGPCRNKYGDSRTRDIAEGIYEGLKNRFIMGSPHFVKSHLHRSKADINRKFEEGVECTDCKAVDAYKAYHDQLTKAVEAVEKQVTDNDELRGGLLLEIHGHAVPWVGTMVGYRISEEDLNNENLVASETTIRNLAVEKKKSIKELITGSTSMGALMEKRSLKAVPSDKHTSPDKIKEEGFHFYKGGYILKEYGSQAEDKVVDAIQFEFPAELRYKGMNFNENGELQFFGKKKVRDDLIKEMVEVIAEFLEEHYSVY